KGSYSNGDVGYYALAVYNSGDTFTGTKLSNDNGYIVYTEGNEKVLVGYNGTETELVLPTYITKINQYAFRHCSSLTSIEIPDSVTSIGDRAFSGCDSLTSIEIPNSVASIGDRAFSGCTSLTSVVIGDSVTSIDNYAFYSSYKLVEVINKSSHITIEKGSSSNGYVGYYALAVYNSDSGITESQLINDNGYIIYTEGNEKVLVGYNGTETELVLPTYITKIYKYAFRYCDSLTSIVIGNSVTSIGSSAFEYCTSLTSVYYMGTVDEWAKVSIGYDNDELTNATRYYYSETQPTTTGNYWHYDENANPVVW
ncbi:MAG: leucine-rich repeat domain-containing protein, partial [Clostridia bacterium]|nr:leucine-rich repeat domain-containing protein [Clostridia bacterium]